MSATRTALQASGARRTAPRRRTTGGGARARRTTGNKARRRPPAAKAARGGAGSRNTGNWWSVVLLVVAVVAAVAWIGEDHEPEPAAPTCTLPGSGVAVTAEQVRNAEIIAQVGWDRGLPDRAVVIALATAQQESRLRNLDYGDRDSLGLFQQRPSQGWGTEAQVQDPVYAAGKFYDGLVTVPGWDTRRLTESADAVQRSAFPEAYQKHEAMAVELTAVLRRDGNGSAICP